MSKSTSFIEQFYEIKYKQNFFNSQKVLDQSLPVGRKLFKTRYQVLFDFLKKIDTHKYRLLDIGTGPGKTVFALRNEFQVLYGVDFSQIAFEQAQKAKSMLLPKEQNKIFFTKANIEEGLSFKDSSFDIVLLLAVLEHVFDPYKTLKEIKRVLKRNGMLILSVPNIAFLKQRIRLLFGKLPLSQPIPFDAKFWETHLWDGGHLHYFTFYTLKRLLIEMGFWIEEVKGDSGLAAIGNFCPSLLYTNFVIKCYSI